MLYGKLERLSHFLLHVGLHLQSVIPASVLRLTRIVRRSRGRIGDCPRDRAALLDAVARGDIESRGARTDAALEVTCEARAAHAPVESQSVTGVYIEVVTDTYAASALALKLHDSMKTLYET